MMMKIEEDQDQNQSNQQVHDKICFQTNNMNMFYSRPQTSQECQNSTWNTRKKCETTRAQAPRAHENHLPMYSGYQLAISQFSSGLKNLRHLVDFESTFSIFKSI